MALLPVLIEYEWSDSEENVQHNFRFSLCYSSNYAECLHVVDILHPYEQDYLNQVFADRRKQSYLAGRYAAKHSLSGAIGESHLNQIWIDRGILDHPIVVHPNKQNIQVSITHCDEIGAALSFPEAVPMGIDIERIDRTRIDLFLSQMSDREKEIIEDLSFSTEATLTMFWTAKESLSKVLKTGLTTCFSLYELQKIRTEDAGIVRSLFTNFPQYQTVSVIFGAYMCSITYPKRLCIDFTPFLKTLNDRLRLCLT
ncbi:4'-phosphopantetheinyl transferase superfamily protein [Bacillus thuringiensis]|uniref:4'-phosphopantetheinyl transferase superfamily protein n=1 Tax=Bacillus thuringiensis TaxID=1428 RepID=UPI000CD8CC97|nr:4'-phosphopantetheinyl transferase superfamily protein [Bacillus thuringiensis]QFQ28666.1 4'-phosphopantetheinyl transferase superfamily protein [Bacillus thuringiensis]